MKTRPHVWGRLLRTATNGPKFWSMGRGRVRPPAVRPLLDPPLFLYLAHCLVQHFWYRPTCNIATLEQCNCCNCCLMSVHGRKSRVVTTTTTRWSFFPTVHGPGITSIDCRWVTVRSTSRGSRSTTRPVISSSSQRPMTRTISWSRKCRLRWNWTPTSAVENGILWVKCRHPMTTR